MGYSSQHVNDLPNRWHSTDDEIAEFADRLNCILISKDIDFKNSFFIRQSPKKLLKINLGNLSNEALIRSIVTLLPFISSLDQRPRFLIELDSTGTTIFS